LLEKGLASVIFLSVYTLLIARKCRPVLAVWGGAAALLVLRVITPMEAVASINLNVTGVFAGTMVSSAYFVRSKVPAYLAAAVIGRSRSSAGAMLAVCVLAGAVSSVVDNVATVLMIAPIAIEMAKCLEVPATQFIIGIAVSANLQGAATLIGDSTSILLASAAKMSFVDFFWTNGRPGIFFVVQLAAVASFAVLRRVFRQYGGRDVPVDPVKVSSWVPAGLMTGMIVAMAVSGFIPGRPDWMTGAIALIFALLMVLWGFATRNRDGNPLRSLDWQTALFLCGLFVLVGSLTATGIVGDIAGLISRWTGGNGFLAYTVIVWMSVVISAFVDNTPYTMAMLPVAQMVATTCNVSPYLMMYGLLLGTTLGGNLTPFGASANVVAVSLLSREGHNVSFREFLQVGLPFTTAAVLVGYLGNWVLWR
jgi:Na+/H+ antiporter NhaD/arsenite permease-like protein